MLPDPLTVTENRIFAKALMSIGPTFFLLVGIPLKF